MKIIFCQFFLCLFLLPVTGRAQLHLSRQAAVDSALKNNPQMLGAMQNLERQKAMKKGSILIDKAEFWIESPTATRFALGIQQYVSFPGVYLNEYRLQKQNIKLAESEMKVSAASLKKTMELLYLDLQYAHAKVSMLKYQDSIYGKLFRSTEKRYSVGDAAYLEKILEETKYLEVKNALMQIHRDILSSEKQIAIMTGISADSIMPDPLVPVEAENVSEDTSLAVRNPIAGYYQANTLVAMQSFRVQRSLFFPNAFFGYLNQGYRNSDVLYRLRLGIAVPLWFPSYTSRIKGARIGINVAELQYKSAVISLKSQYAKAIGDLYKNRLNLNYYQQTALRQAEEILRSSTILYNTGEITYFAYLQGLAQAMSIKMAYLDAIRNYNASAIELNYLMGR
jgi:cobalt-zinc-cadmium resistance protein CzcA